MHKLDLNVGNAYRSPLSSLCRNSSWLSSVFGSKFGVSPRENISNSVTPYDQTSDCDENLASFLMASGEYLKFKKNKKNYAYEHI